ncbi:MBL fold metallo-hydrolase [Chloroflexota bacterium]
MAEVIPGIHHLKLPISIPESSLANVNAYLIRGDRGYLLVDAGLNTDEALAALQNQLAEIGADIKDISQILLTHIHPDHYGMAGRIKRLSGAEMTMHDIEKRLIGLKYINEKELLKETAAWLKDNGVPHGEIPFIRDAALAMGQMVIPDYPDTTLQGGETMATGPFTFRVIWTPGHSDGHICLYEPQEKILISGDLVLPTILPTIIMQPKSIENPLGKYLDSLKMIRQLDIELVLPGHEEPFTRPGTRIDEIIRQLEQKNRAFVATLSGEPKTTYQVARSMNWSARIDWPDLPAFRQRMAIFQTLANLEMAIAENRSDKFSRDGIVYYRQV